MGRLGNIAGAGINCSRCVPNGEPIMKAAQFAFAPNYKDTMHVPIDNTRSTIVDFPVEAGRPLRILLHANAGFLSKTLRTTVE